MASENNTKPNPAEQALLPAVKKTATPSQIKFYEGEIRELLELALTGVRLYCICRNGYLAAEKQQTVVKKIFVEACKTKFGKAWKGRSLVFRSVSVLSSHLILLAKSPEFTKGISNLVQCFSSTQCFCH